MSDERSDKGYVNFYDVLGLTENANPGEARKTYKKKMKNLVSEIASVEITGERRAHYLLEMAKLNAAIYILRDKDKREEYWSLREELIDLEEEWRAAPDADTERRDALRKAFDGKVRHFLSTYVEEAMLEAGRDKDCVDASHWDLAHERHATRMLRHYRHGLFQDILERLPFSEVTLPEVDWEERARTVDALIAAGSA
jgi:hypothetical protein